MKQLLWLGAVWPLVFFPFLADPTPVGVRGTGTYAPEPDTTYADGRYAALVPGVTDTLANGPDTMIRFIPDPDSIGVGVPYRAIREPGGDDYLVLSYDTLVMAALDSSQVDSIWSDWGLGTPLAYAVDVPQKPTDLTDLGITATESSAIAAVVGFPYKTAPYAYSRLTEYDSILEELGAFWYGYLMDDTTSAIYITGQQYDRVALWYRYWWRTGDTTWLNRAQTWGRIWRDGYVLPNDGAVQTYYAHVEGMAIDWFVTGDSASRSAVLQIANKMNSWINSMKTTQYRDGRIQGYAVLDVLWPALLNLPDTLRDNDSTADAGIDSLISWYAAQDARPGHWYLHGYSATSCPGESLQANFQVSHALLYTLGRYYDLVDNTKDTIPVIIKATLDTIWADRHPDSTTITYLSDYCSATNDTSYGGGKDLGGLFVAPNAWYFRWTCNNSTCDSTYFYRADTMLSGLIDHVYWGPQIIGNTGGNKQYNQSFSWSQLGLYWLSGGP